MVDLNPSFRGGLLRQRLFPILNNLNIKLKCKINILKGRQNKYINI